MADSGGIEELVRGRPIAAKPARFNWTRANLDALAALVTVQPDADGCPDLIQALHPVFAFEQALVLDEGDDGLHCIAAAPASLVGRHWPDDSLRDAQSVRAIAAAAAARDAQAGLHPMSELAAAAAPALYLPIGIGGRLAWLALLRAPGAPDFSEGHVAAAIQYATTSLAMLIARRRTDPTRPAGHVPQDDGLLSEIVERLPLGLTVQDETGRFILANAMAAANLGMSSEALIGATPADFLPDSEAASRREWEQSVICHNTAVTVEAHAVDHRGSRTWLTSHQPARILDRTLLISSSIDITDYKQVERELAERAHIDKLTGLPDRVRIQQHVEALFCDDDAHRRRFAIAFIDLDNFKHVNDYYSHAVGDAVLVKTGQRIANRLRPGDMLARISGDEFLLLLDPGGSDEQIRAIVEEISQDLKRPFHIEAFEIFSSCTIGVSVYPDHGRDYEVLRRNADSAMYRAKEVAKGDVFFFDRDIARAVSARMEVEQRLRLAIRDGKFCCAFQPKIDIHSQQVVGFETLVRWRDDNGDIHPPGQFVGLAIELGLINPITQFVVAEAINSIDRLDAAFGGDTTVSVNIAAKQAGDVAFMTSIAEALKDSGRAERIIVELTEEAFIVKGAFQTQILPLFRDIGVRVSIDDFGTGYSSLSALADITADEIKIDRSFISGIHERPRNQSVLRAIESLGRALGMTVVAEGVETYEELAYLRAATRIRYVQGYYFSKPLYLDDLIGTLDLSNRAPMAARERPATRDMASSRLAVSARSGG